MGNDSGCKIVGKDLVMLILEDNREILLNDIRHVPELRK